MHFEAKNLSWSPRVDVRPAPRRVRQRGPTASTSGTVTIDLEVSGDEDAVILHDNDGVLPWQIVYACSHRLGSVSLPNPNKTRFE